nr:LamG domain-containing protein [Chitinophagaceae bacterium]
MKKYLFFISLILLNFLAIAQTPMPIASYPFNGNANDAIGSNNGTVNGATLTTDRFGNANSAYSFDGVDDNISINHNAVFNLNNYSISVWFKYNGAGTAGKLYWDLISKNSDGNGFNEPFHLFVNASEKATKARVGNGSTEFGLGNTSSIDNGNWHQTVLVFDNANDAVKLFVDGILISTVTNTANPITNTANIKIGFWEAYNNFFNGAIDDIKIYNTPLTDMQIQADYNQSIGLIASYPFTGNANDAVGTNNGTVNGATLT